MTILKVTHSPRYGVLQLFPELLEVMLALEALDFESLVSLWI